MRTNAYAILPATVRYNKVLSPSAKLVYAELSAGTDHTGHVKPDIAQLSAMLTCTSRTTYRYLSELVEQGLVQRDGDDFILPLGFEKVSPSGPVERVDVHDEAFYKDFLSKFEKGLNTYLERQELYYSTLQERLNTFSKSELMRALDNRIAFVNSSEWHQRPENRMNACDLSLVIKDDATVHKLLNYKIDKQPVELKPINYK